MSSASFENILKRRTWGVVFFEAFCVCLYTLVFLVVCMYLLLVTTYFYPDVIPVYIPKEALLASLIGVPLFFAFVSYVTNRRNPGRLAVTLEKNYPSLAGRLTSALEFSKKRKKLNKDAFSQALAVGLQGKMVGILDRFDFSKAVAPRRVVLPLLFIFFIGVGGFVHWKVDPSFFKTSWERLTGESFVIKTNVSDEAMLAAENLPSFEIQVNPGDCEIPRKSNLFIKARILDYKPEQVLLCFREKDDPAWRVVPMSSVGEGQYVYLLSRVSRESTYYIKADHQTSAKFNIELYESLTMNRVFWKLEYPKNTNLSDQIKEGWKDKLTVPKGTKITLSVNFNQPVGSAFVKSESGRQIPLMLNEISQFLETSFIATRDAFISLDIQDVNGNPLLDVSSVWIQTLPDLPPFLDVKEPQLKNYVNTDDSVPFEIFISDDYGVDSVEMVILYKGKEQRVGLVPKGDTVTEITLNPILEIEPLGLSGSDLVFVYIEVRDRYFDQVSNIVRSPYFSFLIRNTEEEYREADKELKQSTYRILFEDVMLDQEKLLEDTWDYISSVPVETLKAWNKQQFESSKA